MTGRFGEADTAGDYGFEDLGAEELAKVGRDLSGQVGAFVVHGEENALNGERVVEGIANAVYGVHESGNAFKGEELALNGDEDGIGCDEGVQGQEIEGGGAVDQNELVLVANGFDLSGEDGFAIVGGNQVEIGTNEVLVGWQEIQPFSFGVTNGFVYPNAIYENLVDGGKTLRFLDSQTAGGVSLGIGIDQQDFDLARGKRGCEVDGGRGFPYAALLVGNSNDSAQVVNLTCFT